MGRLLVSLLRAYDVTEHFIAGNYPGHSDVEIARQKLQLLTELGVTSIVNLMEAEEVHWRGGSIRKYEELLPTLQDASLRMRRFPIVDMDVPSDQLMREILDYIDAQLEQGETVYLHCLGGVGRTGTVVGCWLARHGIALGEDALTEISRLREYDPMLDHPSPQTEAQSHMVRTWTEGA